MAAKSKAKALAKKTDRNAKSKKPQGAVRKPEPQPKWMRFIVIAAASLTVIVIINQNADYFSKHHGENASRLDTPNNSTVQEANLAAKQQKPTQLSGSASNGDQQTDHFDFYRILEQENASNVPEVKDIYRSTPKSVTLPTDKTYLLQAGSFRSLPDADKFRAKLLLKGLEPYIQKADIPNHGIWYRVFVGPYRDRSVLNKAQDILVAQGITAIPIQQK